MRPTVEVTICDKGARVSRDGSVGNKWASLVDL